jgi:transcription elongation factor GreA
VPDLVNLVLEALEQSLAGDRHRAQNQLRALFEDRDWLAGVLQRMAPFQREALLARINGSRAWDLSGKRSVLGRIIKAYPELEGVLSGARRRAPAAPAARLTSWRSYRARQEQFRKLIEETIPENSREIATARGYGDLSENFEYQTAKDRQRLLGQRKNELEADLGAVKGTDFAQAATERAGMGTCVRVRRPDGRTEQVCILGEWDSDAGLGIVANGSRVAQLLAGRAAGEEVALPSAAGEEPCRIVEVGPLPDEVRAWIAG